MFLIKINYYEVVVSSNLQVNTHVYDLNLKKKYMLILNFNLYFAVHRTEINIKTLINFRIDCW